MDKLDKFIQDNRQSFDSEEPSTGHFDKMQKELGIRSYVSLYKYAAVLILALFLTTTVVFVKSSAQNIPVTAQETKAYYSWMIQQKLDSLIQQNLISECQLDYLKQTLKNYQVSDEELNESAKENPNSDYISNTIVNQYQLQLQVINNVVDNKYFCNNLKH